jgi:hypothetical protein
MTANAECAAKSFQKPERKDASTVPGNVKRGLQKRESVRGTKSYLKPEKNIHSRHLYGSSSKNQQIVKAN